MQYDMLTKKTAERYWDTFLTYDRCINDKYRAFAKVNGERWHSDRDRLIGRLAPILVGKYFALADKEIIAYNDDGNFRFIDSKSIYYPDQEERIDFRGEPVYRHSKKYLFISSLCAVNEMYGHGFIQMRCYDIFMNTVNIRLDCETMAKIQFKEITKEEFERVSELFMDDREDRPYLVTRYLSYEEMKKKRKSPKKGLVKEQVTVMAKEAEEALKKVENSIDVEVSANPS